MTENEYKQCTKTVMDNIADPAITFDEKGNATDATMKPIAPVTDFSFDFGDLKLKKVN